MAYMAAGIDVSRTPGHSPFNTPSYLERLLIGHYADPSFHVITGGLLIGAIFMATDYVTSPVTKKGMLIFGAGCGVITVLIRLWGAYPEGVSFAILLMNATTPLIDRYTKPRVFGAVDSKQAAA